MANVLLLDDEEAIRLPAARYFRTLGHEVDMARSAEEALALLSDRDYDLAILDLRLGTAGNEGLDVLREIRRGARETRVVVLSAYVSTEVEAEARELGADGVLAKPQPLPILAHYALSLAGARRG